MGDSTRFAKAVVGVVAFAALLAACSGGGEDSSTSDASTPPEPGAVSTTGSPAATGTRPASSDATVAAILATFPPPGTEADVVGVPLPSGEVAEIAAAVQDAIDDDPEWFAEHLASVGPGDPLPYDPRFGVTQAEYEFMLQSFADVEPAFVGVLTIGATPTADGRVSVTVPTQGEAEADLIYDPVSNTFDSPFGTTGQPIAWQPDPGSFLGEAQGWRWQLVDPALEGEDVSGATGASITITIAVAGTGERTYLGVVGGRMVDGEVVDAIDLDLIYDTPGG